jgi:hypothetical protein
MDAAPQLVGAEVLEKRQVDESVQVRPPPLQVGVTTVRVHLRELRRRAPWFFRRRAESRQRSGSPATAALLRSPSASTTMPTRSSCGPYSPPASREILLLPDAGDVGQTAHTSCRNVHPRQPLAVRDWSRAPQVTERPYKFEKIRWPPTLLSHFFDESVHKVPNFNFV